MELTFEYSDNLGMGSNPSITHMPDGTIWLFDVSDGKLRSSEWNPPNTGDVPWGSPSYGLKSRATSDKNISLARIKNIPRVGVFGSWHQEKSEIIEAHRVGIWDAESDITDYLSRGSIQLDLGNIISSASFEFLNIDGRLYSESSSKISPGKKIELFFTIGDSEEYPMGVFYVDKVEMTVGESTISVDCRSMSGKLLKDQLMNADYKYEKKVYAYLLEEYLTKAGITNFDIQPPDNPETAWQLGMTFPVDMDRLTGLNLLIESSLNWVVRESLDGSIIAGSTVSYPPIMNMNSTYSFLRDEELFSRRITKDDSEVYSRVCVTSYQEDEDDGTELRSYTIVDLEYDINVPLHKVLYIRMPDNTPIEYLDDVGAYLAEKMSRAGIVEEFEGPFRPYLIPGDEAEIIKDGVRTLVGGITTIIHSFGKKGFKTIFTVDSASISRKKQLIDEVNESKSAQTAKIEKEVIE